MRVEKLYLKRLVTVELLLLGHTLRAGGLVLFREQTTDMKSLEKL